MRATILGLTLVVVAGLGFLANWRFHFLRATLAADRSLDRGFRFDLNKSRCANSQGSLGISKGFFGPCGLIENFNLDGFKIENREARGITVRTAHFSDFFIEWLVAPLSVWENVEFKHGTAFELEMRRSIARNLVFDDVRIEGGRWLGTRFEDCTFRNLKMADVSFRDAIFVRTKFENVECRNCDFRAAIFEDSSIDSAFKDATYNEKSRLPFPIEDAGIKGFRYRP
jgi:hypothetical protein